MAFCIKYAAPVSCIKFSAPGSLHQVFLDRVPCIKPRHLRNSAPYSIRTALWFMAQRIAGDHVVQEFGDKGLVVKY
jgi:hypothetical protein